MLLFYQSELEKSYNFIATYEFNHEGGNKIGNEGCKYMSLSEWSKI